MQKNYLKNLEKISKKNLEKIWEKFKKFINFSNFEILTSDSETRPKIRVLKKNFKNFKNLLI